MPTIIRTGRGSFANGAKAGDSAVAGASADSAAAGVCRRLAFALPLLAVKSNPFHPGYGNNLLDRRFDARKRLPRHIRAGPIRTEIILVV
jgi:hypothetical protein